MVLPQTLMILICIILTFQQNIYCFCCKTVDWLWNQIDAEHGEEFSCVHDGFSSEFMDASKFQSFIL